MIIGYNENAYNDTTDVTSNNNNQSVWLVMMVLKIAYMILIDMVIPNIHLNDYTV